MYPSAIAGTVVVPEFVSALNTAIQHGLADFADVNTAPTLALPFGPTSEFQVASPVIGSVNLDNAKDINGAALSNTIVKDKSGNVIPQRSNVIVTTAFTLPGANASLKAFRQYQPVADATQASGYKFKADGTRLWLAKTPVDPTKRNLYTANADGTIIPFDTLDVPLGNLAVLAGLMNLSVADATAVITAVRNAPLGSIVDSTPAIMNPPSLDPPPDDDYPAFAVANKNRRSIIWVGTNAGILEGIDARLGIEAWGFIPLNLLPKLKAIRLGQGLTTFEYYVDGSAKVADVKIDGTWRTHLIMGEGPGGVFFQSFDVTMAGMFDVGHVTPDDDNMDHVLAYFTDSSRITFNWAFPRYSSFDPTATVFEGNLNDYVQFGDVKSTATAAEKTVGQTWSDPAVGQMVSTTGPFTVLLGSGFLPYTTQQQANRGGKVAGTTFYVLSAKDGTVYDTKDVGSDGKNETIDNCSDHTHLLPGEPKHKGKKKKWFGCNKIKNALQSDPVATGPADSRFITKAYMGDLDGMVWRFDMNLDSVTHLPKVTATTKLWESGQDQPIFSSMATVNVGGANQYIFFGTGSDLLPSVDVSTKYHLLGVLDNGATGAKTFDQALDKTNDKGKDEKVTAFPAVAGDIVFFTTTTFQPANACKSENANLYALTFIGGAAYDSTGDDKVDKHDKTLVKSIVGERATAPFIVDQHLVFGTASKVAVFGDPSDFNNGVGQAGVRVLSWREVR
jgi:Tfp pilus tip-associated adhesin PilY1